MGVGGGGGGNPQLIKYHRSMSVLNTTSLRAYFTESFRALRGRGHISHTPLQPW